MLFESYSYEDTLKIAKDIGKNAQKGDVFCLIGGLGAGKTAFAQGFAKGLNTQTPVTSPTFTIINEYIGGRLPLYHFDVYRIAEESNMDDTGYEEYFYGEGVCLVEWAELIEGLTPPNSHIIRISQVFSKGASYRAIEFSKEGVI